MALTVLMRRAPVAPRRQVAALWLAGLMAGATLSPPASADTVWYASGTGKPIAFDNIKITKVEDGNISFISAAGALTTRKLEQVTRLKLDDEPAFNAGEESYERGDWVGAGENYKKTIDVTQRDWVKDRATVRLLEAAEKSGQFSAAVGGFLGVVARNASDSSKYKPKIPTGKTDAIDAAIADVKKASEGNLKPEQKSVLLNFLAELYGAKGDTASAGQIIQQLSKVAPADMNKPENRRIRADFALTEARNALAGKQYPQATRAVESNGALFTEPQQQAEALFILAEAKEATAKDEAALRDAALAYMRVVAHFKSAAGAPHVTDALLKTAAIEEKLKKPDEALSLYKSVVTDFKGTPAAERAQQGVDRLTQSQKQAKS